MKKFRHQCRLFHLPRCQRQGPTAAGTDKPIGPLGLKRNKMYGGKPGAADFTGVVLEGSNPTQPLEEQGFGVALMPPNAVAISGSDACRWCSDFSMK